MIIILASTILFMLYFFRIRRYSVCFAREPIFTEEHSANDIFISVIIPYKNEEENLPDLIRSLKQQNYNKASYEVLLINDHSTDDSSRKIKSSTQNDIRFIHFDLPEGKKGKKAAIDAGIAFSKAEVILLTDADCIAGPEWLKNFSCYYQSNDVMLISSTVKMIPARNSFRAKFEALEFMSLTGSGAASFMAGRPVMCSAANLFFEKRLYLEAKEHLQNDFPSGDDMFLMLYLNKHYPGKGAFLKSEGSIVKTPSTSDLKEFITQRTRWSSKALLYRDVNLVYLSVLVFLMNLSLIVLVTASFVHLQYLLVYISIFILKSEVDYTFLKKIASFTNQKKLLKIFLPSQLIYPFYIFFAAIGGFVEFYRKKGFRR